MLSGELIEGNDLPAIASLTVLNVTSNLDGATLVCYFPNIGVGGTVGGVYPLKIYRKLDHGMHHHFVMRVLCACLRYVVASCISACCSSQDWLFH